MEELNVPERKKLKSRVHGLIKIKFLVFKEEKNGLADEIAEKTDSTVIGIGGNILILH